MTSRGKHRGFSLVEVVVATLLLSVLAVGAYRSLGEWLRPAMQSVQRMGENMTVGQALDFLTQRLENAVSFKGGEASLWKSQVSQACGGGEVATALVGYPGYTAQSLQDLGVGRIDPSVTLSASALASPDALRFYTYPADSQEVRLAVDSDTQKPFPTLGFEDIVVPQGHGFKVGDYLVIYDGLSTDLLRITGIETLSGQSRLKRSDQISHWNMAFTQNYGLDEQGNALVAGAYVRRVVPMTVAYQPQHKRLVFDEHVYDDGFDPSTGTFQGSPGYAYRWQTLLIDVDHFQVFYGVEDEVHGWDRTPRAAVHGKLNPVSSSATPCGNQLGHPYLKQIRLDLTSKEKVHARLVSLLSLQQVAANSSDLVGVQPPTAPTPTPSHDPCPSGYSTTYVNDTPTTPYSVYCETDEVNCIKVCEYKPCDWTPPPPPVKDGQPTPTPAPPPVCEAPPAPTPKSTPPGGTGGSF